MKPLESALSISALVTQQTPGLSFAHHFNSPTFTVHVGQNGSTQSTFYLPRHLLARHSAYFAALLNGSFKEATDNVVTLDTEVDRVAAFNRFVEWLFLGDYSPPTAATLFGQTCISHARVYVLAERLCTEKLKALALKKMSAQLQEEYDSSGGAVMDPSTIVRLVEIVYPYTRDAFPDWDDGVSRGEPDTPVQGGAVTTARDPMRHLIARYIGSALSPTLRADAEFSRLMCGYEGCKEFPYDLLEGVAKGDRLVSS